MHTSTIYFASPLFTQAEWQWNNLLAEQLRRINFEVILPQERAAPMLNGTECFDALLLFQENIAGIEKAQIVLAVLDQADADSGTCWECGYAYKHGIPIIGLRTDIRPAGDDPMRPANLMLSKSCRKFILLPFDKRDDVQWIVEQIVDAIRDIQKR